MAMYPPFHKYVTRTYFILFAVLVIVLPLNYSFKKKPSVNQIIIIYVLVGFSYLVYWVRLIGFGGDEILVRTNCYGERINLPRSEYGNSSRLDPTVLQSTTNISTGTSNSYPTFANYRFASIRDRLRRIASNRSTQDDEDAYNAMTQTSVVQVPPPTYGSALSSGEGLPPPYQFKTNEISENENQLESVIISNASARTLRRESSSVSISQNNNRSPSSSSSSHITSALELAKRTIIRAW
ncbi:9835_t:CDS:2 [Ambispora gerdemannii]|uniref:9835_t:CDS:1 n=1 Tax=Ambispora gerdemannii TaxID=144530 RepID=A0A9N9BKN8_9GLOM|nr:9835_t:CDS:2 [Ambispora gerdemannii]